MKNFLTWFIDNRVATNLLMWFLILGGLIALPQLHREEFPNIDVDLISVLIPYPGASPEEVEQTVCSRVEENINGTPGIKKITSLAAENSCNVQIELLKGEDKNQKLNEIKSKIDSIDTFPNEAEKPVIQLVTLLTNVLQIFVYGDTDPMSLKRLTEKMRLDLIDLPEVSQVFIHYAKDYEISVEVTENTLRRYGLNLRDIAQRISQNSIDLPAGSVDTVDGQILIRTVNQARDVRSLEDIIIISGGETTELRLGDIAHIKDGFVSSDVNALFNGKPALMISVKRIGNEDVINVASSVKDYLEQVKYRLPNGVGLALWADESQDLVDRLDALGTNGLGGLVLVLIILALFLRPRLAFWVAISLPITLLGTLITFPFVGVTISTISVVGTLLILGILVDAGVVVAERIYTNTEHGQRPREAAINGVNDVATPVIFGVLTSIAAFTPLIALKSGLGSFFSFIGVTAILALIFSLITSQLILPMQLSKKVLFNPDKSNTLSNGNRFLRLQDKLTQSLLSFANQYYRPSLKWCLNRRYLVTATGLACLILTMALLISGRIIFQFFPAVDGERLFASVSMPIGTSVEETQKVAQQLVQSGRLLEQELKEQGSDIRITDTMVSAGIQLGRSSIGDADPSGGHQAEVALQIDLPTDHEGMTPNDLVKRWRNLSGNIPKVDNLTFTAEVFSSGKAIEIELRGRNITALEKAAADLSSELKAYPGVMDIVDSFEGGKRELKLTIKDSARSLNLTAQDLATQVRQAFYGEEVQRLQRGREDLKIMVRYPKSERRSLSNIEQMQIRTTEGSEIPFSAVAEASMGRGTANIKRINGLRVISVTADVDRNIITPEEVLGDLESRIMPALAQQYDIAINLAGEAEEKQEAASSLLITASIAMFALSLIHI